MPKELTLADARAQATPVTIAPDRATALAIVQNLERNQHESTVLLFDPARGTTGWHFHLTSVFADPVGIRYIRRTKTLKDTTAPTGKRTFAWEELGQCGDIAFGEGYVIPTDPRWYSMSPDQAAAAGIGAVQVHRSRSARPGGTSPIVERNNDQPAHLDQRMLALWQAIPEGERRMDSLLAHLTETLEQTITPSHIEALAATKACTITLVKEPRDPGSVEIEEFLPIPGSAPRRYTTTQYAFLAYLVSGTRPHATN